MSLSINKLCFSAFAIIAFVLQGCMSTDEMAPPVHAEMVRVAERRGYEHAALNRGRAIYLTDCSKCHSIEPIDRYSERKWKELGPDMADESKLTKAELDDLMAYLLSARETMVAEAKQRMQAGG